MIAAIEWVPQGVAKKVPLKYDVTMATTPAEEEEDQLDSPTAKSKPKVLQLPKKADHNNNNNNSNNLPADLRMDDYSDDEEEDGAAIGNLLVGNTDGELEEEDEEGEEDEEVPMKEADKAQQDSSDDNDDDDDDDDDNLDDVPDTREYTPIDVNGLQAMGFGEDMLLGAGQAETYQDDESDAEDVMIQSEDAVMVVAKTEEDFSSLEVHIYDTKNGNMFIHHDIPLPSFPLCLAHGQTIGGPSLIAADNTTDSETGATGGGGGNFCAVGTFDPGIEIWNLDIVNVLEPSCVLGGMLNGNNNNNAFKPGSHTGAVMGLSWNQVHRHVIASGSADHTVKIWDVSLASSSSGNDGESSSSGANAGTFSHHKDKVQSVVWHPVEATILATGSYDRTVALVDARDAAQKSIKKVRIPADCEALTWDPFHPECLTAACEDGSILTWDVRNFVDKKPLWSFVANEFGGINDISYNRHVPGLMAAASTDKTVSLWDVYNQENVPLQNTNPRACARKDMKVGKLYTVSFYPSSPWLLSCGGSDNQLALWDMSSEDTLWQQFAKRAESLAEYDTPGGAADAGLLETITGNNNNGENSDDNEKGSSKSKKKKKGNKKKKAHKAR